MRSRIKSALRPIVSVIVVMSAMRADWLVPMVEAFLNTPLPAAE